MNTEPYPDFPEFESGPSVGKPRTRSDEIKEKKEEAWKNFRTQEEEALAVIQNEYTAHETAPNFATCDLPTLMRVLDDTSGMREKDWHIMSPQARNALCQLIQWRIIRGSCEIVDQIENGMRELFEQRKETHEDLHVMWRRARRPLVQYFQQSHIQSFIERHDIDGNVYARMLRYVGHIQLLPSCELMFGNVTNQVAHLKSTDTFEDALITLTAEQDTGFWVETRRTYRGQWPYETDPQKLDSELHRLRSYKRHFRDKWIPDFQDVWEGEKLKLSKEEGRWHKDNRLRWLVAHYQELEDMETKILQRQTRLAESEQAVQGRIALNLQEDGTYDVVVQGNRGSLSLRDRFLSERKTPIALSDSDYYNGSGNVACISNREMMSPNILTVLHEVAHAERTPFPVGDIENELLLMQLQKEESEISVEAYIEKAREYAQKDAHNERKAIQGTLILCQTLRIETGIDVRGFFQSFQEFRDYLLKPYAEGDSALWSDGGSLDDEEGKDDGTGHAMYIKQFFKGEKDTSIIGWMDAYRAKDEEKIAQRSVCKKLTDEQKREFDEYVDQQFDVPGLEKELQHFWEEK